MRLDLQSPYIFLILSSIFLVLTGVFLLIANFVGTIICFGGSIGALFYAKRLMTEQL